jgi:hypothetical protein
MQGIPDHQPKDERKPMNEEISREAKQLAADLDKAPTGEIIIQTSIVWPALNPAGAGEQELLSRPLETMSSLSCKRFRSSALFWWALACGGGAKLNRQSLSELGIRSRLS